MSKRITLCTCCKSRLIHLKQTLPLNIKTYLKDTNVDFLLLNYNSQDHLDSWVRETFLGLIKSKRLTYYKEFKSKNYSASRAKNIAHRLATGDIVFNIDSDVVVNNFANNLLQGNINEFFITTDKKHKTVFGICGFWKEHFTKTLFGYNEQFSHGWGYEDKDILHRAQALGLRPRKVGKMLQQIPHSCSTYNKHYEQENKRVSQSIHKQIAKERYKKNIFWGNDLPWGQAVVQKNFGEIASVEEFLNKDRTSAS